jgi:hypothetical protein
MDASNEHDTLQKQLSELRALAEAGHLEPLHLLLDEYMDGGELNGFRPDYTLARHFARIGMEKGSVKCKLAMARILQNGYNGEPEPEKAEALFDSLVGTEVEMQSEFYRKNLFASATDYIEFLTRKHRGK